MREEAKLQNLSDFENKSLLERHRMVYTAMGELMSHDIHALSMKTLTPEEWDK